MSKVGIYKIGFKEQKEIDDEWIEQDVNEETENSIEDCYWFNSIDQTATELTEDLVVEESGSYYKVHLPFVVRKDADIAMAQKYAGKPVAVYVEAVDGKQYTIGTASYPAYMVSSNRYAGMDTREVALEVNYQSKTSLLR